MDRTPAEWCRFDYLHPEREARLPMNIITNTVCNECGASVKYAIELGNTGPDGTDRNDLCAYCLKKAYEQVLWFAKLQSQPEHKAILDAPQWKPATIING